MARSKRRHRMPFGVEETDGGHRRFRLWAPGAQRVELCLNGNGDACHVSIPMHSEADGWFECTTALAHVGSRYRYRIDGDVLVPDPASRFQPQDVHGPSEVVDPLAHAWAISRGRIASISPQPPSSASQLRATS